MATTTVSPEGSSLSLLSPSNNKNNLDVIRELVQGYQSASQLKFLLQKPFEADCSLSAHQHLAIVLRSFTHSLSLLTSSHHHDYFDVSHHQNLVVSGENVLPPPPDGGGSRWRSTPPAATKNRRGCYKRRRTEKTWTIFSSTADDTHAWRKYGQKEIMNFKFPRSYLRCTRKYEQGCKAVKQVQRIKENPELYQIIYIGCHTCTDILKTSQLVVTESPLFATDSKNIPNPIKQDHHHPKEESPYSDDFTGSSLDPSVWSDLKDLSEAAMVPAFASDDDDNNHNNAETVFSCSGSLDFGAVDDPDHYVSDDFHFHA